MGQVQTLEELKEENAAVETKREEAALQAVETEEVEELAVESDVEEVAEGAEPPETLDDELTEAWMQTEEQDSGDTAIDDHQAAAIRRKYQAQAKDAKAETAAQSEEMLRLQRENEQLRSANPQVQTQQSRPTLAAFDYDEDKYGDAMETWTRHVASQQVAQSTQQAHQAQAQREAQGQSKSLVDAHYGRVGKLVESGALTEDEQRGADHLLRSSIESAVPGKGDLFTDELIARVAKQGGSSEKLVIYLSRHPSALAQLRNSLVSDPTGLDMMLNAGQLMQKITAPTKKTSQAPQPGSTLRGDAASSVGSGKFKKAYDSAHKANNSQRAFDARQEARAAGVDVSKW